MGAMDSLRIFNAAIGLALASAATLTVAQPITGVGERAIARSEVAAFVGEQFADADTDKDGTVTRAELGAFRARLDTRDQAIFDDMVAQSFDQADVDGDREIARWEVDQRAMQLFDLVDVNQDGIASTEEQSAAAALANLEAGDVRDLLGQGR